MRRTIPVLALLWGVALALASSPARAEPPVSPPQRATVQEPVAAALNDLGQWVQTHRGTLGAAIARVGSGAVLGAHREHAPMNPASNQKLATAAAALARLGPAYRYTTSLLGELDGGRVARLVLRGHGDPSLGSDDLLGLAQKLTALGVHDVGDVLVDQSRFDESWVPPGFGQQPTEWATFRAPISAVAVDGNAVTLSVLAATAGQNARAWFSPGGFVDVQGAIATRPVGAAQNVQLTLRPASGRLEAQLGGWVAEKLPLLSFSRRVDDPSTFAGHVLVFALKRLGVKVSGKVAVGGSDATRLLASTESEPLGVLLHAMGKRSDNFYAEMILKTLGAEAKGPPGKSQSGAQAVTEYLTAIGIPAAEIRVTNGSGLYDTNRMSASALLTVLRAAYRSSAIAPDYLASLSIGGVDGTLSGRFRGFAKTRAIRAKTGTLNRAIALSGYVLSPEAGDPVAFSLLVNGIAGENAALRQRIDKVVTAVAVELWGSPDAR